MMSVNGLTALTGLTGLTALTGLTCVPYFVNFHHPKKNHLSEAPKNIATMRDKNV